MKETPIYLSLNDASAKLGISYRTLYNWCKDDKIPYIKLGVKYMVDIPKTLELLRSGEVTQ